MKESLRYLTVVSVLLVSGLVLGMVLLMSLYEAWAIRIMWGWFLTAYMPVPDLLTIIGANLVINVFIWRRIPKIKDDFLRDGDVWKGLLEQIAVPAAALLVGWVYLWLLG